MSMLYFVRVNGNTVHNNPGNRQCYVKAEPPQYPHTYFDYLHYCLQHDVVRIGWPDTGDLLKGSGNLANCYTLPSLPPRVQGYLTQFRTIPIGADIIVPDKSSPGYFHMCTVTSSYSYFHSVPAHPYECAHRVGVTWDRHRNGTPIVYQAWACGIPIRGGFWRRAFAQLDIERRGDIDYGKLLALRVRR